MKKQQVKKPEAKGVWGVQGTQSIVCKVVKTEGWAGARGLEFISKQEPGARLITF